MTTTLGLQGQLNLIKVGNLKISHNLAKVFRVRFGNPKTSGQHRPLQTAKTIYEREKSCGDGAAV